MAKEGQDEVSPVTLHEMAEREATLRHGNWTGWGVAAGAAFFGWAVIQTMRVLLDLEDIASIRAAFAVIVLCGVVGFAVGRSREKQWQKTYDHLFARYSEEAKIRLDERRTT